MKPGDTVKAEDPLVTLESDKAAMDVPAPRAGRVEAVTVKVGDKVSEGSTIVKLAGAGEAASAPVAPAPASKSAATKKSAAAPLPVHAAPDMPAIPREVPPPPLHDYAGVHASPAVTAAGARTRRRSDGAEGHGRKRPHHQG